MAKNSGTIYTNGATVRLKNKRIDFTENEDSILCTFLFADSEPNKPAASHYCLRGKVRVTRINLSKQAMNKLVESYLKFLQANKRLDEIQL
jgi:hypothetical protein